MTRSPLSGPPVADPSTAAGIRRWATQAARAADDKLGRDTILIDVGEVLSLTDLFVVTSGANRRQVRAIVDEVEEQITLLDGPKPLRLEGREHGEGPTWVLMDFGGFVVHVFDEEARAFYDIERLWSDRPRLDWQAEA
jgi:ribosome-associated protein